MHNRLFIRILWRILGRIVSQNLPQLSDPALDRIVPLGTEAGNMAIVFWIFLGSLTPSNDIGDDSQHCISKKRLKVA